MTCLRILLICGFCLQAAIAQFPQFQPVEDLDALYQFQEKEEHQEPDWYYNEDHFPYGDLQYDSLTTVRSQPVEPPTVAISKETVEDLPVHQNKCAPPNGGGISSLLRAATELLPQDKIKELVAHAIRHDPEVQALRKLLQSPEFRAKAQALRHTPEISKIHTYACDVLHFDVKDYYQFEQSLFNLTVELEDDESASAEIKGRPGIRGLIADIRTLLPKQELHDLFQKYMDTDQYVVQALRLMRANKFTNMVISAYSLKEYQDIRKLLVDAGMPVHELSELAAMASGIHGDEFGTDYLATKI